MLDLERIIDAAVAEAPAPDMTRVRRVVTRRRRRRAFATATVIGGLLVAGAVFLVVPRDGPKGVTTTHDTAAPTTRSSVVTAADFSTVDVQRGLAALGHDVRVVAAQPGSSSLLGASPARLCVDGARAVQVYEYTSDAARLDWSHSISRDGGSIAGGNKVTQVLWIAPPHFFARGKIIALYVGSNDRLIADLATLLGRTLDPNAPHGTDTREQPC